MKFQKLFLPLLSLFMASSSLFGQSAQHRNCGTMGHLAHLKAQNPALETNMAQIEKETQKWIAEHGNEKTRLLVTIPVVVHVVYNTTAQNISTAQVQSQIDILNEDYRRLNADKANTPSVFASVAADVQIEFCLATTDPTGATTTGITRTQTATTAFLDDDAVKATATGGRDAWNTAKYLNLWVCNLSGGLLGYAQFPGGAANTDGVVILYSAFGNTGTVQPPYNKGRTATHEVGHWLNLYHIWGDDSGACSGSDLVSDTPNQGDSNGGCPTFPNISCSNTPNGDMFMNYMDYTDDNCMNMFTNGQATRMTAIVNGSRSGLLTSQGCSGGGTTSADAGIVEVAYPSGTVCSTSFSMVVVLKNYGTTTITAANINYNISGGSSGTYNWTGSLAAGASTFVTITGLSAPAGAHSVSATAVVSNDTNAANNAFSDSFVVNTGAGLTFATENFQSLGFPASGWGLLNYDGTTTWARTTTAGANSSASMYMNNYDYTGGQTLATGQSDALVTPLIHVPTSNGNIEFDIAYAYYQDATGSLSDSLKIGVSTNCGQSYSLIYNKGGAALQTVAPMSSAFTPTATQWRHETLSLSSYAGQDVIIRFRNACNYANNMYIDNINLTGLGVAIEPAIQSEIAFSLYPNPTEEMASIEYQAQGNENVNLQILDLTGRIISEKSYQLTEGTHQLEVNVSTLASGYYFVKLTENAKVGVQKLRVK
jgi:hypothetical protein